MDQMYVKVFADCNIFLTPPLLAHSATLMIMIITAMMSSMIMMKKTNLEPAMVNILC